MSDGEGQKYFKRNVIDQWITVGRLMIGRRSPRVLESTPVRPSYSSVMVTQNCNYKCVMCSFWHARTTDELSLEEVSGLLRDMRRVGIRQVNFTGGEPLLRDDLVDIISAARREAFEMIQVTTNGSLATEKRLESLVDAGVRRIAISCDGVGVHHDTQRGVPGAWGKNIAALDALRAIRSARAEKIEIELAMVLSKITAGDLKDLLRVAEDYDAVVHLQFLDDVQYFTTSAEFGEQMLSPEEVDRLMDEIHAHIDGSPAMDPFLTHEGIEYARSYLKRQERANAPPPSCGVGYAMVYVDSRGNVFPGCFAVAPLGNVREQPLHEIIGSPRHCEVAQDLMRMNCPRCPNGYAWGVFTNPGAMAREVARRTRRKLQVLRAG
jgi:MoaA/NifB/PqqE/SkfB family radical SAM enzyme